MYSPQQPDLLFQFRPDDLLRLFDNLIGVYFFLKDAQGRHVAINKPLIKRLGYNEGTDLVGATDYDLFPRSMAEYFLQDDQRVLRTGESITNFVESWRNGEPVVTSKFPIRNAIGTVTGIAGIFQVYEGKARAQLPDLEIEQIVGYIRSHLHVRISIGELADKLLLSVRQFHRRFRKACGMSVQEFLIKERVAAVREALLDSNAPIAEIAGRFGFCDQSALTKQFRALTGTTPFKFRQQGNERKSVANHVLTLK